MDCRQSLLVALSVALGCCGCVNGEKRPTPPTPVTPESLPPNAVKKEAPTVKRQPKPETLVSWAACQLDAAKHPGSAAADQMEKRDAARKAYQQALQIDPNFLPAYLDLARLYTELNDYDRALDTYRKAIDKHPREVNLWSEMGMCLARKKDFDGAIGSLSKALEIDPENRRVQQTLGFCLARAGRTDDAVACLSGAIGPAQAHVQVARMMLHLGQHEVARRHLHAALHLDANLEGVRELLAPLEPRPAQPHAQQPQRMDMTGHQPLPALGVGGVRQ